MNEQIAQAAPEGIMPADNDPSSYEKSLQSVSTERSKVSERIEKFTEIRPDARQTKTTDKEQSDQHKQREYYEATDEENAHASLACQNLMKHVEPEELPQKAIIWDKVRRWSQTNEAKDDSPISTYLPYEWPEKLHIREYLRRRLATIRIEVCQTPGVTMQAMSTCNSSPAEDPAIPERLITESIHFKDVNGESLLLKINTGAEECFEGTGRKPMHQYILEAVDRLHQPGVEVPAPSNSDTRHPATCHRQAKKYWNSRGKPCGVFHFACWRWNHTVSRDVRGRRKGDFGPTIGFFQRMAPIQQAMSLWYEAIDSKRYNSYRNHVEFLIKEDTGMLCMKYSNNHSFLGLAALRNVQVHNHKDNGDVRDGWVGMTCAGSFTGGELCLPDLDVKLRFLPGDIVFFRSCVLQHFIASTIGERSSLVFFSHSSPTTTVVQNTRFINKNDPAYEAAFTARAATRDSKARKEVKRSHFAHLPPYPTTNRDLTPNQIWIAGRRKRRFIKHAREALKVGKIQEKDLNKIIETEDARFYELNLGQLSRWAKGKYPFGSTKIKK